MALLADVEDRERAVPPVRPGHGLEDGGTPGKARKGAECDGSCRAPGQSAHGGVGCRDEFTSGIRGASSWGRQLP